MGAKLQLLFVTSKFLGGKMKGICKSGLMALCYAIKRAVERMRISTALSYDAVDMPPLSRDIFCEMRIT